MTKDSPKVSLVGAGPGDPELITVRGMKRLQSADVVIYDELAGAELLAFVRDDAELIFVGKRCGKHAMEQERINALLVEKAREGKRVIRLKGGDPFIFGRGGEELAELVASGIAVEVVPGVTAAAAAGSAAGVPLTHRELSSGVIFLTGHEKPGKPESSIDWHALAATRMTLCIYMGVKKIASIAERLVEGGLAVDTPVAIVSRATWADQQTLLVTLSELIREEHGEVPAPALAIIGPVARLPRVVAELAASAGRVDSSGAATP
ncbi:siroheme synthase [mine drainage metagenome]|uniref:uroporphyrinogen-III C-methyltransferase n=1 Tax=mine drainage metagenome TaxID=410659 RepID=A0A1J5SWC8_9ZZZZ